MVPDSRKRSRRYESTSKIQNSAKRRRRRSTSSPRRKLGRKRTVSPIKLKHEKMRRRKIKKEVEHKSKQIYLSSSSDEGKSSPYDSNLLKAAIRRTDIKKSPKKLNKSVLINEYNKNGKSVKLESSEDIESNILELRLQALQSTELLKKEPEIKKPEIDDKEEHELRCIALKSAMVKKHEARLRKKLELRPYSPTDVIHEKIEVPFISPILSPIRDDDSEQMDISPDISSADCIPVDMVFSSERSNSPTYFNGNVNGIIINKNDFNAILTEDNKNVEIQKEESNSKIDLKPEKKLNDSIIDHSLEEDCLRSLLLSNLKKKKKDIKESPDLPNLAKSDVENLEVIKQQKTKKSPPPSDPSLEKNNKNQLDDIKMKCTNLEVSELVKLDLKVSSPVGIPNKNIVDSVVKLTTNKTVLLSSEVPKNIPKKPIFLVKPQMPNEIVKSISLKPKKVEISPIFSPADSTKTASPKKIILKPKIVKPIQKKIINVLTPTRINQSIKALTIDIPTLKKIHNTINKSPLSVNLQSKKVSPMIIRLGVSSESEDEFYNQQNIENNKPALIISKSDVPKKVVVNINNESNDVPVNAAPPEFEIKLDQFLKNARSKLEKKTVTFPKENSTPMVSSLLLFLLIF